MGIAAMLVMLPGLFEQMFVPCTKFDTPGTVAVGEMVEIVGK